MIVLTYRAIATKHNMCFCSNVKATMRHTIFQLSQYLQIVKGRCRWWNSGSS